MLMNEHIDWYFPVVSIALLAPMMVGACFFVVFFTKDKQSSRGKIGPACTLAIIALSVVAAWNVIYFVFLYKKDKEVVF